MSQQISGMQEIGVLKKLGIKGRVLLLTLLPTSLMALVLGGYFTWTQQSDLQTQLLQRGEMIAEQLAPLVAPAMGQWRAIRREKGHRAHVRLFEGLSGNTFEQFATGPRRPDHAQSGAERRQRALATTQRQ